MRGRKRKQYLNQREPRHEVEISDAEQAKRIAELEKMLLGSWEASG